MCGRAERRVALLRPGLLLISPFSFLSPLLTIHLLPKGGQLSPHSQSSQTFLANGTFLNEARGRVLMIFRLSQSRVLKSSAGFHFIRLSDLCFMRFALDGS